MCISTLDIAYITVITIMIISLITRKFIIPRTAVPQDFSQVLPRTDFGKRRRAEVNEIGWQFDKMNSFKLK